MLSAADEHLRAETIPPLSPQDFIQIFLVAADPEMLRAAVGCETHTGNGLLDAQTKQGAGGGGGESDPWCGRDFSRGSPKNPVDEACYGGRAPLFCAEVLQLRSSIYLTQKLI